MQHDPIDLGKMAMCNMCKDRFCTCPERGADGSWNSPKTTHSEDWERYWDFLTETGASLSTLKDFIRETRTAAYEEGFKQATRECEGCKLNETDQYEKGVRDSLEVVEKQILWEWPSDIITTMGEAKKSEYRQSLKKSFRKALATLLGKEQV